LRGGRDGELADHLRVLADLIAPCLAKHCVLALPSARCLSGTTHALASFLSHLALRWRATACSLHTIYIPAMQSTSSTRDNVYAPRAHTGRTAANALPIPPTRRWTATQRLRARQRTTQGLQHSRDTRLLCLSLSSEHGPLGTNSSKHQTGRDETLERRRGGSPQVNIQLPFNSSRIYRLPKINGRRRLSI